jgi:hypothetical protein
MGLGSSKTFSVLYFGVAVKAKKLRLGYLARFIISLTTPAN